MAAYVRRCHIEGVFAAIVKRGAEEAGAIFIKLNRLDGSGILYGPAPQAAFDDARPVDRMFTVVLGRQGAVPEADIDARLKREIGFDPDLGLSRSRTKPAGTSSTTWWRDAVYRADLRRSVCASPARTFRFVPWVRTLRDGLSFLDGFVRGRDGLAVLSPDRQHDFSRVARQRVEQIGQIINALH